MAKQEFQLESIIAKAVEVTGFELWGVEFVRAGKHSILRVFIEHESGITVDNCAEVSRQVSAVLDVEDPISSEYTLEVSSPGLDRLLFKIEHFAAFANHQVDLKTKMPINGRRKFKGLLKETEGDSVVIEVDREEYVIPIKNIDKAQVVPQF
ncbi:ribosome maturation factor RimP [Catenovulum sp. 2E275]|uniref:ribosome maturation factor RimP n=1 Tax=Catenovulum sp. 2E275 TaxID=2980497 RepID=UPI0021D36A49|nr:ribosome maturation factor RimP [Catenovulum sp. 2E275]MCU4676748.1 ribosome maturation factor RimP [Catenovulum sp. 2E275]